MSKGIEHNRKIDVALRADIEESKCQSRTPSRIAGLLTDLQDPALARGLSLSGALYVRPSGLLDGDIAARALEDGVALPLAGGPRAFTLCEIILRDPAGDQAVYPVPAATLAGGHAGEKVSAALDALTAPRAPIRGLSFERPLLMGVVNVTPDSFSDGGQFAGPEAAVAHGRALADAGADILDIGGESSRPGAAAVPVAEELARVMPVIAGLRGLRPLSIDTRHAEVMDRATAAGATIINDVTALTGDSGSIETAAASGAHVVLTHGFANERGARLAPREAVLAVFDDLRGHIAACRSAGIDERRLIIDPGVGFGKSARQNLELLRQAAFFHGLGCPLLLGVSRKLGRRHDPAQRLPESLAGALWAGSQGVQILRVHDVAETHRAFGVLSRLEQHSFSSDRSRRSLSE
ncbi:MAG: dihydropteroate synthase [Proteobacteria bacterium]|nr:dihydropteroate synthase [Pseudomonadota bacterium]